MYPIRSIGSCFRYSVRSERTGSTGAARRVARKLAPKATMETTTTAPKYVEGLFGACRVGSRNQTCGLSQRVRY